MGYRAVLFLFLLSALQVQTVQGLDSVYVNCFNNILAKYSTASGIAVSNMYQYLDQAMSYFCLNIAADYRNCLTTNPAYPIDVLINKYFSMSDLMLTCLVKYRKQAGTNFVKCMMNPTLLSYNEKCVEDAVTRHNSNVPEESNAMQMISCVSGVFTNCTGFGIDMSDVPILFDLIFPEFKKNYTIANTDLKSVQCLFKTDMFTEQDFVTISDHVSDLTNSMNLKNILREIYLEFIPRLCDIGFKIKNETILTTFRECMVDSTTEFSNAVERTIMSCFKHTFVSETNANFFCAHVYKNHDGEIGCLEALLDYMVANLIISGMFNFIPAIISSPEGLDSTEGCNFCSSFGNFLLDQSNVLQYCSGGYAIEHSFLYSELQQCPANQTLSPTAPQATAPQTTSKPTEPPTTSKPTAPQTTPAPTAPQTTPAPTQPQTTPAPTQPQTTPAPTQPQTTPAPTQPQTTPAPTTSSTAKSSTTTSKTLSKSIKIITNADFSPFCPGGLFPYEGHDKHKLNDLSTPEIKIPCGLPACDTRYGSLFLNPNGYAALGSNYESNKPTYLTSSSHDMIAMYWYNMDISENGMYYKVYNVKNDDGTLDRISEVVRAKRKTVKKFDVIWALVVTWIRAKPKFGTGEITFQGIVATDGEKTFQVMNFYYSSLGDSSTEYPPVLGVKCSEKPRVRKRFTYNTLKTKVNTKKQLKKTIKAFQIHKYPKDCNGRFVYNRLSKKPPRIQHPQRGTKKCWKWYKAEMADLQRIKSFQLRVQTYCYCSKWMEQVASDSIENPYPHNRRNLQCFFITPPFGFDEAVECCYKRYSNAHIDYEPNMGSMVTIRTTKQKNDQFKKYRRENKYPRKWCCTKSDNCALYFKARPKPAYSCGVLSWFWIFWLFGDPHIITLDGRTYTFNGLGEYTLIKDQSNTFEIQARTCKALNKEGKEINATVFCGFAGKKDDGSSFQILLDGNRENFKLRVNDDDYTSFYKSDEDFAVDFTNISAERNNESLQVSMSGLKLTFSIVSKTLKLDTSVSKNLTGLLKGLLGNFDGDDTNDFILPNGTDLPKKNHTEKELFYEFGQKWATTEASSIFYYDEGKSFTDYNDKNFIPLFAEDFSQAERDAAEANCTGEDNEVSNACVIDYLYTGDPGLAKSSGDTQSNVKNQTETLQNQQPLISGPSKMVFTVGQQVEFKVNGSDDGKFTYKIVNSPKTGSFALNETTGHGAWTANSDTNEEIQLTVIDDKGAEASPWTIKIFICKNCSGNGECDQSKIEDYTDTYNVLPCTCNTGWEGDDCDKDIDACALSPCDPRQNCTDVSPTEHQATGVGHKCTACPSGYSESSNTCIDVNECNNAGTNTCDQLCVNTEGSYYCECKDGYRMVEETCKDINECEEVHDCEQQCLNTEGNSTCGCFMGFTLNNDKKACTKVADMCTPLGLNCDYACMNNTEGQVVCTCKNGYKLAADGKTCEDINECSTKLCSQTCNNTEGSFTCSCYDGYILQSDKLTCSTCDEEHWGPSCANDCECDGDGIEGCDPAFGCYCNDGYKGANCSEDRNECEEQPTICGQDKACNNLDGSYECECLSGFIFDDNNENCIDIDECFEDEENADNEYENNCTTTSSTCENVAGGFTCKCKDGFKQKDMYTCEDIDECQQGANDCEQECVNRIPGFYCKCRAGFVLNDTDDRSCIQESNPCEGKTNKTCSYACHLVGTTAECYCKIGYKLASDQQTCIDIDECSNSTLILCSEQDKCQNTEGGYTCSCSSGYFLDNDKRTCTGCDMFHYGDSCSKACNCHPLGADRCDPISGCVCNTGWAGSNCSSDLDECQGTNDCTHSNQECVNTFGSYECRCKSGYDNSTGSCKNIDECASGDSQCEQGCVDKDGSFTCTCPSGFQLNDDEQHCDDIDECAITSTCEQNCLNTDGGYMCYCNDGYKLNTTDRRQCYVETECSNGHGCQHNCALVNSVNVCSCKNGYALHSDNKTCNNMDECTTSKPCSDTCTDKDPGFNCSCPAGKYLSADTITCKDCDDGKYGANCSSSCSCATDNTETCDKVNGACTCKTGWKGTNCDVDVDECSSNSHSCQEHSTCNNTQGGYNCDCHTGYAPSSGIQCIECSGQKYGVNCENDCTCVIQNTEICNKINGICDCKSGWNGTRCESDINECQPNNPCTGGKECKNNDGSYTCKCASGYRENANGVCEDVDECYESQVCHKNADCDNVVGSYNCTCKALYIGDGITCSAPHVDNVVGGPNFDNGANDATSRLWYMLLLMTLLLNI